MNKERTCIICGKQDNKSSMLRIARLNDSSIVADIGNDQAGRGAYVCSISCLENKAFKARICNALKANCSQEAIDGIKGAFIKHDPAAFRDKE